MDTKILILLTCLVVVIFDMIVLYFVYKFLRSFISESFSALKDKFGQPKFTIKSTLINIGPMLVKYGQVNIRCYSGFL